MHSKNTLKESISLILYANNNQDSIGAIIEKLINLEYLSEIIIVDDGSTDNTLEEIQKITDPKLRLFHFENEKGRSSAQQMALSKATGDILVFWSSTQEYDPDEILIVLAPIWECAATAVWGSRFLRPRFYCCPTYFFKHFHHSLNCWMGLLTNIHLTDCQSQVFAVTKNTIQFNKFHSSGDSFSIELLSLLKSMDTSIVEVPLKYNPQKAQSITFVQFFVLLLSIFEINIKRIFKIH